MTVRERVLTIKLMEQQEKHPEYLKEIGVRVIMKRIETVLTEGRREERV